MLGSHRDLYFTFKADQLAADELKVVDFTVEEGLSHPFAIQLTLASRNAQLTEESVVDQNGVLTVYRNQEAERSFHGVVFSFTKGDTGRHHTFYKMVLVPEFSRLSLRTNSRIFQEKTVVDIAEILLAEMGITKYALAIRNSHEPREFCVQYCETDLEFIERLFAEEGIFYYFEHTSSQHTVVFADDNTVTEDLPKSCFYNNTEGGLAEMTCIRRLVKRTQMAPTEAVLNDYSFKQPHFSFLTQSASDTADYQRSYEYYEYPGRYKDEGVGKGFSQTRINYLRRDAQTIEGDGDISEITSGYVMQVDNHPSIKLSEKWLVTHVKHIGTQPQSLDNEGSEGSTTYKNNFYALPYTHQWKPQPEIKPRIYGPQIATVVGPSNEEIYTDEFGRVKVQFPWDRYGESDENSSCWIRVSQVGAGAGYGNIVLPRIGHEVIVSFLEGDPDQPVVTGATFHATNRASISLPRDKTMLAFRGKTHDGKGTGIGYNEITFENDDGRQMMHFYAQKDMDTKVLNNQTIHVEANRSRIVDIDDSTLVKGEQDIKIIGAQRTTYKNTYDLKVTGVNTQTFYSRQSISVLDNQDITISNNRVINVGNSIDVTAGVSIRLNVGASTILMLADGTISVSGINITVSGVNVTSVGAATNTVMGALLSLNP